MSISGTPERLEFNRKLIAEFRANNGKVTGVFADAPLLILTTTGARTGQPREKALVYTTDADRIIVIASKGGADTNPDWYYNLKANPTATVELPGETFTVHAREVTGEQRDRLYAAQAALRPAFVEYAQRTTRVIPVFALERVPA